MLLLNRTRLGLAALAAVTLVACSDDDPIGPPVNPPPGTATLSTDITSNRTFYAETTYTLAGFVHVSNGATLTIEPGTTILGTTGSALFIMRGSRIMAEGTAADPIVFTSDQAAGSRKPGDWGGLILIGNGVLNRSGSIILEGTGTSATNPDIEYSGGTTNTDNSGSLRYVRVEFAGFGPAQNQELNSFTFAAVGSGTQLSHLQSLAGLDDSFEWFGGAVDSKYLVSYESGDDHFDASEGYVGRNQYLIAFQSDILDPRAGAGTPSGDPQGFENDGCGSATGGGCDNGYNSAPLTIPMFANFTLVGTGPIPEVTSTSGGVGMVLRRGVGGYYVNGVIARWPKAAISLRDAETQTRYDDGELILRNILVVETGATAGVNGPLFESGSGRFAIDSVAENIEKADDAALSTVELAGIPAAPTLAGLDFSLTTGAEARAGGTGALTGALATKGGTFVTGTAYRGAWDPAGPKWWSGWTNYAKN
jgi:hypothetical protein